MKRLVASALLALPLGLFPTASSGQTQVLPHDSESAAFPDGPASLLFNPAAAGVRYPSELALTTLVPREGAELYRAACTSGGFSFSATGAERRRTAFELGLAGGAEAMRIGFATSWLPERDGHSADHRAGILSRPAPWISIGAVADHLGAPRIGGMRLERAYTLGIGLRPLAVSPTGAHGWGTRWTLTGDAELGERERADQAHFTVGTELEIVPGLELRGLYLERDHGFQLGISLHGVRAGLQSRSGYDEEGRPRYAAHTLSFHRAEDATVFAGPAERRVALVRVAGDLGDDALSGFSLLGPVGTTPVGPIRRQLERALEDPLTRGVLIDLGQVSSMAQIEELRPRIARLRAAGKPVVAYLESGAGRPGLYLAAACDRIVTTPEAMFAALGLRAERRYYRRLLHDWGVRLDRSSYGKYKSAYRNYSVDSTSAADREDIDHQLDVSQDLFVSAVSADRHIDRERLLTVLDGRSWRPVDLQHFGVIDSIGYKEDALRILGKLAGLGAKPRARRLSDEDVAPREWTVPSPVAVIYASGAIESGKSGNDLLDGPYMGSETVARQIESAFRNRAVKAVVLRVESPGGTSLGSDLIHHAAERMKRETKKPLIISMGRLAASGGYHISVPGDRIYCDRFTRTGSIGVLFVRPSFERWYAQHHVRQDAFERGPYMRGWSQGRDWDAEMQASADSSVYQDYREFVSTVAEGRHLSWEAVDRVAQGRVWMGDDAVERKLVDQIGGLDEAIAEARRRAGVPAGERIRLVEYRRPRPGLFQRLAGSAVSATLERNLHLPDETETLLRIDDEAAP